MQPKPKYQRERSALLISQPRWSGAQLRPVFRHAHYDCVSRFSFGLQLILSYRISKVTAVRPLIISVVTAALVVEPNWIEKYREKVTPTWRLSMRCHKM